jgi:hypothetical protein
VNYTSMTSEVKSRSRILQCAIKALRSLALFGMAIERRAIHRWWCCHLSRRRTTAHRRGFRNEVTDVAGRCPAKPHSRVRFALTEARPRR